MQQTEFQALCLSMAVCLNVQGMDVKISASKQVFEDRSLAKAPAVCSEAGMTPFWHVESTVASMSAGAGAKHDSRAVRSKNMPDTHRACCM